MKVCDTIIVSDEEVLFPDPSVQEQIPSWLQVQTGIVPLYETADTLAVYSQQDNLSCLNAYIQKPLTHFKSRHLRLSPVINTAHFLKEICQEAQRRLASDIHFSHKENQIDVSFRCQGEMTPFLTLSQQDYYCLLNQIKLKSDMDISLENKAQDGRLEFSELGLSCRVSSLPTLNGEDIVLRLINRQSTLSKLNVLGFSLTKQALIRSMINNESGLVLVTGPTGSGKTTTLYAMLDSLFKDDRGQIVSLEDPIEKRLNDVRQCQINVDSGLDFNTALRATLRQDPDIIMLGEIRDKETAHTALHAAYTGHLVISSLHTDSVASTCLRLNTFDLDPFLISQCLRGIVAQKLVKNGNQLQLKSEVLHIKSRPKSDQFGDLLDVSEYRGFDDD
jgi:type II secretory ATPase GspE/PulE/Tfp pilus assembly ATPase PilB-like protein